MKIIHNVLNIKKIQKNLFKLVEHHLKYHKYLELKNLKNKMIITKMLKKIVKMKQKQDEKKGIATGTTSPDPQYAIA